MKKNLIVILLFLFTTILANAQYFVELTMLEVNNDQYQLNMSPPELPEVLNIGAGWSLPHSSF
jgi:hypothetical protein